MENWNIETEPGDSRRVLYLATSEAGGRIPLLEVRCGHGCYSGPVVWSLFRDTDDPACPGAISLEMAEHETAGELEALIETGQVDTDTVLTRGADPGPCWPEIVRRNLRTTWPVPGENRWPELGGES